MRTETREMLVTYLTFCEYQLDEATRHWDLCVQRMRDNPNMMNVFGVWQGEQLSDLMAMRVLVLERDRACRELRAFIEKPKSRFRYPKKMPKERKKKTARL
jgi:hypothetical protein